MSIPGIGHNGGPPLVDVDPLLKGFVERIERLEEEKKNTAEDIRSVYAEAKERDIDVKALRVVIKYRREDAEKRAAREAAIDDLMIKLGMV